MRNVWKACVVVGLLLATRGALAQEAPCPQPAPEPQAQPPVAQPPVQQPPEQQPPQAVPPEQQPQYQPEQGQYQQQPQTEEQRATAAVPNPLVPGGMSLAVGGGVMNFFDGTTRDFTGVAGTWEARLAYGTRWPVTIEGAYVGSAQSVDAFGLDPNADLLGTSVEGDLRLNILPYMWLVQPYILAGAGWYHWSIVNESGPNLSDVKSTSNAFSIPLGVGVAWHYNRFLLDARGVVRPEVGTVLIPESETQPDGGRLDNWSVVGRIGFEF